MHPFGPSDLALFIWQIAYYKIPRYIKFVDEYPMTASGKVSEMKVICMKMNCLVTLVDVIIASLAA